MINKSVSILVIFLLTLLSECEYIAPVPVDKKSDDGVTYVDMTDVITAYSIHETKLYDSFLFSAAEESKHDHGYLV